MDELTITEAQDLLTSGRISAREMVQDYLHRIEAIDRSGPTLRSIIETNEHALEVAESLDRERAAGTFRGPLHGIPIVIKDNIETAGDMQTTAGSMALVGAPVERDAFIVQRLREAGAVLLGKTNLSEWANFRSTRSSSGWSARGGQTKNPHVLNRSASGSSSGSGAAIAANLAVGAIGTETDGSIVSPSGATGIVGMKPTVGLVSCAGVIPISHNQDTPGPMTRTVADTAALLTVIAGPDNVHGGIWKEGRRVEDYTLSLDPHGLEGARLGIVRDLGFGKSLREDRVAETAIEAMEGLGATTVDVKMSVVAEWPSGEDEFTVLLFDFKNDLNRYLASRRHPHITCLADVIQFNLDHADTELLYFDQNILLMAQEKGDLSSPDYLRALYAGWASCRLHGIDKIMDEHGLDALVAPTNAPAWLIDLVNGDHIINGSSTPAAVAGYPSITVPAGFDSNLPIGVTFFGRAWSEAKLIKLAYSLEQHLQARRPPQFLPTVP